jgi:clan AA aspartic protease
VGHALIITGHVTAQQHAVIPLTVQDWQGQPETVDAIVDTGFNGFLTLPLPQIARLRFPYEGIAEVILGDGDTVRLDAFAATVLWGGEVRTGLVLAADGLPLIGMGLLSGSRVCLEVTTGGPVTIERLP